MIPGSVTSSACDMNLVPTTATTTTRKNGLLVCSQQSILSAMERFVKSINNMDATVLVPSKLRDMDIIALKQQIKPIPATLNTNTELHNFYNMLNDVKKELLWGTCSIMASSQTTTTASASSSTSHHSEFVNSTTVTTTTTAVTSPASTTTTTPFNRSISVASSTGANSKQSSSTSSQSDDCLGSLGSGSISSNASDTESDADSMLTDRDTPMEHDSTSHLFVAFRHHLQGLNSILNQLADSADYLSARYQEEIEDHPSAI